MECDATSHQRILREGKPDWDLDVIAGPRGAVLFALDLAYEPDLQERVFRFGSPRDCTFRFPVPAYIDQPQEVLRVDADGITQVKHTVQDGIIEIRDQVSRVAIYIVSLKAGESQRLESQRQALIAQEESVGFAPDRDPDDLAVFKELVERK